MTLKEQYWKDGYIFQFREGDMQDEEHYVPYHMLAHLIEQEKDADPYPTQPDTTSES